MSENNFNVCSRCGGANPLSARYCYQCGFELKSPDSPVVCTKCNTVNLGTANFCKRCGSKLPKAQSKVVCPQCSASNNASATFCANCGYDFTTHTMPSSLAISQKQSEQVASSVSIDATNAKDKKLSRKEKKQLKREEEKRLYQEELASYRQAKLDKKEAKKQAKQAKKQSAVQPQVQPQPQLQMQPQILQYPMVVQPNMQYIPPVMQQVGLEQKPKKRRLKNFFVLLIALAGLFFILLPQKFNFLGSIGALFSVDVDGVAVLFTGWDAGVFSISQFLPSFASMSSIVSAYETNSLWLFIMGVVIALTAVILVFYVLAKLIGVLTGRPHKGLDVFALICMLATGALCAIGIMYGLYSVDFTWYSLVIPATYLLIVIFNSKLGKN